MIRRLLSITLPEYLNSNKSSHPEFEAASIPLPTRNETTDSKCFDIQDKSSTIIREEGLGSATYLNGCRHRWTFIDYEHLINSLPEVLQHNLRRPDFIGFDNQGKYVIINELSQGKPANKRSKAKLQLSGAVQLLSSIPEIKQHLDSYICKWCVFSCRSEFPDTPNNMADAFGINHRLLPKRIPIKFQPITKYGFEAFETDLITIE